jgi:AraC family transcriptional regulator
VPNKDFHYTVSRVMRVGDLQLDQTEFGAPSPPVPRHFHERGLIAFVLRGHVVDENRGRRTTLLPGNVLFLPPGEPHAVSLLSTAGRVFSIEVGTDWLANALGGRGEFPVDRLRLQEPWVSGAAARLYHCFSAGPNACSVKLEELVQSLFCQPLNAGEPVQRPAPRWLRRAMEVVADRSHEPIRMRDVAAEVGVHPVTLSRSFHSSYGMTLSAFLQRRRLELARVALATSDLHIGAIALAHGFADHAHFTRTFRRFVGMAPSAYRAALRPGRPRRPHVTALGRLRPCPGLVSFRASDAKIFAA